MQAQNYFDYNATTPCAKEVIDAMLPFFNQDFGNASSSHHPYGWEAKTAIEESTDLISRILDVPSKALVYTSGSTESINMVIKGVCRSRQTQGKHILTSKAEHKAVLDTCEFLEGEGFEISYLDVDQNGLISIDTYKEALRKDTILIIALYANNETGVIQDLEALSAMAKEHGVLLFSDTTQALGKLDVRPVLRLVDFACFSGHKVYGPKGVGLTYINPRGTDDELLPSFIQGGGQQRSLRGGTLNTPGIVGLAKAIELAHEKLEAETKRLRELRDLLEKGILDIELSVLNGGKSDRLVNTTNVSFKYVDGPSLLRALGTRLAVSNGSACNSASVEPSHVLRAMGIAPDLAYASLRFSLGRYTTVTDVEEAIKIVTSEVARQRENNILWERR